MNEAVNFIKKVRLHHTFFLHPLVSSSLFPQRPISLSLFPHASIHEGGRRKPLVRFHRSLQKHQGIFPHLEGIVVVHHDAFLVLGNVLGHTMVGIGGTFLGHLEGHH